MEGGADDAADDETAHHALPPFESHRYEYHRREDKRHKRHARYGVGAHDGNGVGCHGGEEEGDDGDGEQCHYCLQGSDFDTKEQEDENGDKCEKEEEHHKGHGKVALCAFAAPGCTSGYAFFANRQFERTADDSGGFDDADDAGHGDGTNADGAYVGGEDLFGRECGKGVDTSASCGCQCPYFMYQGNQYKPGEERAHGDDERVTESHQIAEAEDKGADIELEYHFEFVCQHGSGGDDAGGDLFAPEAEGRETEVEQPSNESTRYKQLGLVTPFLAGHQDLCSGGCLGEGELAVHIFNKVFAEGN